MKRAVKNLAIAIVTLLAVVSTQQATAVPGLDLPDSADMTTVQILFGESFMEATLSNFDPAGDYDISPGTYPGWCADRHGILDRSGQVHQTVELWSTYDSDIPIDPTKGGNWNMINWIINQQGPYTAQQVQFASWYYLNGLEWTELDPYPELRDKAKELADAAVNHDDFEPGPGEVMLVLCDVYPYGGGSRGKGFGDYQDIMIEVPIPEASTLMLFGVGVSGLLFFARKKGLIKL